MVCRYRVPRGNLQDVRKHLGYIVCDIDDRINLLEGGSDWWSSQNGTDIFNTNTGNVGIGTTNPTEKLSVVGNAIVGDDSVASMAYLDILSRFDQSGMLRFKRSGSVDAQIGVNGSEDLEFYYNNTNLGRNAMFYNNGAEVMRLNSVGNVGIGTTDPTEMLHVDGNIRISPAGASINFTGVSGPLSINWILDGFATTDQCALNYRSSPKTLQFERYSDGVDILTMEPSTLNAWFGGNVGIGVVTPTARLDVTGEVKFSGTNYVSYFYYDGSTEEDTYIRSGKAGGRVVLQDITDGYVTIGGHSATPLSSSYHSLIVGDRPDGNSTFLTLVHSAAATNEGWGIGTNPSNEFILYNWVKGGSGLCYEINGDTGQHRWLTNNTERMRLASDGKVGIGVTSPSEVLHVSGKIRGNDNGQIHITDTRAAELLPSDYNASSAHFEFTNQIASGRSWDNVFTMGGWSGSYGRTQILGDASISITDGELYCRHGSGSTWGPLRKVILDDGAGNVTIEGNLTVNGSAPGGSVAFDDLTGKSAGSGDYHTSGDFVAGSGSGSIALTVNDGYGNANLTFNHQNGIPDVTGSAARIETTVDSATASFSFELGNSVTANNAVSLTQVLYMTVSSVQAKKDLSVTGSVTATADVTAYSDRRLKDNIAPIIDPLGKLAMIGGYTFNRNDLNNRKQAGVIAQEVQSVLPEAVFEAEDGKLAVSPQQLIGLLVAAVNELASEVAELRSKVEE